MRKSHESSPGLQDVAGEMAREGPRVGHLLDNQDSGAPVVSFDGCDSAGKTESDDNHIVALVKGFNISIEPETCSRHLCCPLTPCAGAEAKFERPHLIVLHVRNRRHLPPSAEPLAAGR
jgi:hypothetical protein